MTGRPVIDREKVRKLLDQGKSNVEIGEALGCKPNSIVDIKRELGFKVMPRTPRNKEFISKAQRHGAVKGGLASATQAAERRAKALRSKAEALPAPIQPPAPKPEPAPPKVIEPEFKIGKKECVWPIGDPKLPGFHYCGEPAIEGKPYCVPHYKQGTIKRDNDGSYRINPIYLMGR